MKQTFVVEVEHCWITMDDVIAFVEKEGICEPNQTAIEQSMAKGFGEEISSSILLDDVDDDIKINYVTCALSD